jgi:chorismate mutase
VSDGDWPARDGVTTEASAGAEEGGVVDEGEAVDGEQTASGRLELLRSRIEAIDDRIIELLVERVGLAHEVGAAKRAAMLPALDPRREAAVVRRAGERARAAGLQDEDVRYIFWHIIAMTRRAQMEET